MPVAIPCWRREEVKQNDAPQALHSCRYTVTHVGIPDLEISKQRKLTV